VAHGVRHAGVQHLDCHRQPNPHPTMYGTVAAAANFVRQHHVQGVDARGVRIRPSTGRRLDGPHTTIGQTLTSGAITLRVSCGQGHGQRCWSPRVNDGWSCGAAMTVKAPSLALHATAGTTSAASTPAAWPTTYKPGLIRVTRAVRGRGVACSRSRWWWW